MDHRPVDTAHDAAVLVLDRLVADDLPTTVIRDGAALLVRRGPVLARVRPDPVASTPLRSALRPEEMPGRSVSGRSEATGVEASVAHREVAVARALAAAGVPATRLVEPNGQPWTVGGFLVSAWEWVDPPGPVSSGPADPDGSEPTAPISSEPVGIAATGTGDRAGSGDEGAAEPVRIDPRSIGVLARTLRQNGPTELDRLPKLDPFAAIDAAVGECAADDPEACFVRERSARLRPEWQTANAEDPLGRSLVHADLHADNVIIGADGPLLTDFELSGVGGSSYDAAPAALAVRRYGAPAADLDLFLEGFGHDPRPWSGFDIFIATYELWVTAWAVGVRAQNPRWAIEAERRVATLRDGTDQRWELN